MSSSVGKITSPTFSFYSVEKSHRFSSGTAGLKQGVDCRRRRRHRKWSGGVIVAVSSDFRKRAEVSDFCDTEWKEKYKAEFEQRFSLPHITDVFDDLEPIPSTFSLKMRKPLSEDFSNGYPSDKRFNAYINNNDRVLLKVIRYSSSTSAGAECMDGDCSWVEQW